MRILKFLICVMAVCAISTIPARGESAKSVLDKTAEKLKNSGGISASFLATSFKAKEAIGSASGTIYVQGNKFKITSPRTTTWFDGKRQWSLMTGSDEAYVSEPTTEELQTINPYTFVNLYKSGYKMSMKDATYSGKSCYEVVLQAKKKSSQIPAMIITIDKSTFQPRCIRIKQQNGNWLRIQVYSMTTGQSWNANFFEFSQSEFPQVDVIDLR